MIPRNIDSWGNAEWERNVRFCVPSKGGAVGVIFVWLKRANFNDPSTSDFVIKPIQGTAAPTKFAERMLKKIAGAKSPNSHPLKRGSLSGMGLMRTLDTYRRKAMSTDMPRWDHVFRNYDKATTFLLQETQSGLCEFGDVYREDGGLERLLRNKTLMRNLGKMFAADALIGNGDRLFSPNMGNIMFDDTGKLSSIDSTTILTNFMAIVNDPTGLSRFEESLKSTQKIKYIRKYVHQGHSLQVPTRQQVIQMTKYSAGRPGHRVARPVLAPSFAMKTLFDLKKWWNDSFKHHLEFTLIREAQARGEPEPTKLSPKIWENAFKDFKSGFDQGRKIINGQISGLNWFRLKRKYKQYVRKYGGDPNLDWNNFKVRRKYFQLIKSGATYEQALATVQIYARDKADF